jgi:exosome complex component MTR3
VHLETALRGVIIGDRWPKSGVEVIITVLEGEEDHWWNEPHNASSGAGQWGMMSVLSGCITVASAAIADAGIDCVDMVSGGVAALIRNPSQPSSSSKVAAEPLQVVLDPVPSEHRDIMAACVVGYLPSRDEITDIWVKGSLESSEGRSFYEELADNAVQAALGSHHVLTAAVKEAAEARLNR